MRALGTSPRRIFVSLSTASGVALAGNLFGITSGILGLFPESAVESTGLDAYYPRGPYKRVSTPGYTFLIPKEWVADTALELARQSARARPLDLSMAPWSTAANARSSAGTLPDVAFGPLGGGGGGRRSPGRSGRDYTNVSVVVSEGGDAPLSSLGTSAEAAETLLQNSIAPPGSGRTARLLGAGETDRGYYRFDYEIDAGGGGRKVLLRNTSLVAGDRDAGELVTLTVVVDRYGSDVPAAKLEKIVESFHLK